MLTEGAADAELVEWAPAKVNLFLHVTGRRADGYHLLDSLAAFPAVGDTLRAAAYAHCSLRIEGPFARALDGGEDNLVLRAARALADATGVPAQARLVLEKRLPVASGIGGGSADGAATLRALARLWRVAIPDGLAARLGADVPVCLASTAARMAGIGDVLTPAPALPDCGIVLLNPGVGVATRDVFAARADAFSPPAAMPERWRDVADFVGWLAGLRNDLQAPAEALCPAIPDVRAALMAASGCLLARMSGSGATCFGVFATARAAAAAAGELARPGWWAWGGAIAGLPTHADAT